MVEATNLKAGTTFLRDGDPYKVVKYNHSKIARGGGTVKLSARNLRSGKLTDISLNSNAKIDEITTTKRPLQFLYMNGDSAIFMDPNTYDQIEVPESAIKDQLIYIKEGDTTDILFWEEEPLSVDIQPKVTLEVEETAPGAKGNSATNVYKPAKLENGLEVKVPLFIKAGDKIRVDTKTGEYVERSN